ncbi:myb-like DNA-binding protein bas1 [Basidiobolus ranarum]|uniref:Myb-like DNA-binding protein bas1 n=1 Tax=Basidiobolus ranarum TaxID=34480 RepID=A0ABR2VU37_9FUNG
MIVQDSPGRISKQVLERCDRVLNPKIKHDSWSPEEDALLLKGFQTYGRDWINISESILGRTRVQSQLRYDQHVNPEIPWTDEENELLLKLVDKYGRNWVQIAQEISTKNNIQVKHRYHNTWLKERKIEKTQID